jgi:hypothetical protein
MLQETFPGAKFIHIVRHPYALFASTIRLWKSLSWAQGLQVPTFHAIEEAVLDGLVAMYNCFEAGKQRLSPTQFVELRYEDLVSSPVSLLRLVYDRLELGGIDEFVPRLEGYWHEAARHTARRYELPSDTRRKIRERWALLFERYGYEER